MPVFRDTQIFGYALGRNFDQFAVTVGHDLAGHLPADGSDFPFHVSHPGFAGVLPDDG